MDAANQKLVRMKKFLKGYDSLAIAYSGGVDSTFLLKVAVDVKGQNVLAVTIKTPSTSNKEIERAKAFAKELTIEHKVIELNTFTFPMIRENHLLRCYHCKKMIFSELKAICEKRQIPVIVDASNSDDEHEYRPGKKALEEFGVISPLVEVGLTKAEIRSLSKQLNLATWDVPAQTCFLTRFEYGAVIDEVMIAQVEKAEEILFEHGFTLNRVRVFGNNAVIEVALEDLNRFDDEALVKEIKNKILSLGYSNVGIDPQGYRTGRMDEGVVDES